MAWIRPVQQILTRTHLRVDNRVPIRAKFRQQNRIRGRIPFSVVTGVPRTSRPGDLHHRWGDAQGAVPRPLGTGVSDALGAATFGGGGDALGDAGGDDVVEVEVEVDAY